MLDSLIFLAGTAYIVWVSRRSLFKPRSHGFYRFFAWECMLAMVLVNFPYWTVDPFSPRQLLSWALLVISAALGWHGARMLIRFGLPSPQRDADELMAFEKTTTLVTTGAFRYIRHPMYAGLLYLAWGIFLKDISRVSVALVSGASLGLLITALRDEAECRAHFGPVYEAYMHRSKRFLPFVF